ncbi:MAG: hypothetical protein M0042_00545 [Nitrospiraceae bacterium]|nr:hypothetical protein [Nitrospiraceae bacterium]
MSQRTQIETIDTVCAYFEKFAETIERMAASRYVEVGEYIDELVASVVDARHQLSDLAAYASLDNKRTTTVLNLVSRYRSLEGLLKESRNDQSGRRGTSARAGRSRTS